MIRVKVKTSFSNPGGFFHSGNVMLCEIVSRAVRTVFSSTNPPPSSRTNELSPSPARLGKAADTESRDREEACEYSCPMDHLSSQTFTV